MATINEHSGLITISNSGTPLVPGAWGLLMTATLNTGWSLLYIANIVFPAGENLVYLDIGIGEAGAEIIIANDIFINKGPSQDYNDSFTELGFPLRFQIGDKISARVKDDTNVAVDYELDLRNFVQ